MRSGRTTPTPATTSTSTSTTCRSGTEQAPRGPGFPGPAAVRSTASEPERHARHRAVHLELGAAGAGVVDVGQAGLSRRHDGPGEPVAELQPEPVVADVHAEAFGHQVFDDHAGALEVAVLVDEIAPVGVQVLALEINAPAIGRAPGQPRVDGGTPARDL